MRAWVGTGGFECRYVKRFFVRLACVQKRAGRLVRVAQVVVVDVTGAKQLRGCPSMVGMGSDFLFCFL